KLKSRVEVYKNSIVCPANNSSFQPLSSDYNSLDGLNIHRGVIDELHAHKTRDLYDVLLTAMGARQHPLLAAITTAGFDRSSICWEQREEVRNIIEGHKQNDAYFGFIATTDAGDDWRDPAVWWKANPNLGISLKQDYLTDLCQTAKDSPAAENNFRRKHLDEWTEQAVRWLSMSAWDACAGEIDREELRGRQCWAGLDLASTRDVNSLVLIFPFEGGRYKLLPFFWTPEDSKDERGNNDRTQVMNWAAKRLIKTTEGNTVDYAAIAEDVMQLGAEFEIQQLAFDPWGPAAAFVQILQSAGFPAEKLLSFRQNISTFAAPTKEFERLVLAGRIEHGGNPVLRWMAGNVSVKADSGDNIKPDKSKSADKIDGIVASIMALGLAMGNTDTDSVYSSRGLITL
ncbi:MAG TPA: terminase TerL endonuclease subunit, partial [Lacipirellula sp.]